MYYYGRDKKRRAKKRLKQGLVALALVGIIAVSYFLFSGTNTDDVAAVDPVENSLQARRILAGNKQPDPGKADNQPDSKKVKTGKEDYQTAIIPKEEKGSDFATKDDGKKVDNREVDSKGKHLGSFYEVKSVAHFYSKPVEKARRKEAINYWNHSYASIKPKDEKNGFVYVEFKYPLGQTTKGWLRKKDLKQVNTVYGNNKD